MMCEIKQPHLLEELLHLEHDESELEDIELQRELKHTLDRMQSESNVSIRSC